MMTLGQKIRLRRKVLRLSQRELSEHAGISQPCVSALENDRFDPTSSVIASLAKALKCTTDYLIVGNERKVG